MKQHCTLINTDGSLAEIWHSNSTVLVKLSVTWSRERHKVFCVLYILSSFCRDLRITHYLGHGKYQIRKLDFCVCENKDADQLHSYFEADQRLCFRYSDITIPPLHVHVSKISRF